MKRLTAIRGFGKAYYPYCYRANTCNGRGATEKCRDCEFNRKICETLAAYENTGLTPEEVEKVKDLVPAVDAMSDIFGENLTVNRVIDAFAKFYLAEDGGKVSNAVLLTNEEVENYRMLKELNMAKVPSVKINNEAVKVGAIKFGEGTKVYHCPNCKRLIIYGDRYCRDCGQKIRWEE